MEHTQFILRQFTNEIDVLVEKGYYLPEDVDMHQIRDLVNENKDKHE